MSLYDVLGVSKSDSCTSIKKAYLKLTRVHHPDKGGDPEKFKEITKASDILTDEKRRRLYDETGMTDAYWDNLVNCPQGQCWVCVWPENIGTKQFIQGIDMDALRTDYEALTNRPFPAVAPSDNPGCSAWLAMLLKNGMKA